MRKKIYQKLFLTTHPPTSLQPHSRTSVSMPLTESDSDINALILDYLTMEGYPQAAANFSKEANLQPMQEDPAIRARQEIRDLIHQGHIQDAIESLNDLDSEVCQPSILVLSLEPSTMIRTRVYTCTTHMTFGSLMINNHFFMSTFPIPHTCLTVTFCATDTDRSQILDQDAHLHFALLRLQLVELIRNSSDGDKNVMTAIQFARDQLGPRASRQPAFLKPLENTMAILLYPRDSLKPEQAAIMHPNLRREVSDMVNKAILHRQTQRREAAIRHLVKIRAWAEESARSSRKNLPDRIELGLNGEDSSHENGSEPMVTN